MSNLQFGFKEQTSTANAIQKALDVIQDAKAKKLQVLAISLDIQSAFNNAWWPAIFHRLNNTHCPSNIYKLLQNYVQDRTVKLDFADSSATRPMYRGCIQGSVCGPMLWNLMLDELLMSELPQGCHLQAFADDILLITQSKDIRTLEKITEDALTKIVNWGNSIKLKFGPQKTQIISFTNKARKCHITMNNQPLLFSRQIKYLGVIIDQKLNFIKHAEHTINKAYNLFQKLSKFIKPTWGINPENVRIIYNAVIEPIICYAASIWRPALKYKYVQKRLLSLQRNFAIKIIRGFRTLSTATAISLAQLPLLNIKIENFADLEITKHQQTSKFLPNDIQLEIPATPAELLHPSKRIAIKFLEVTCQEEIEQQERKAKTASWWNKGIQDKKVIMIRKRRRIKNAHPGRRKHVADQYLEARRDYINAIENATTTSWVNLCNKEEKESMWQRTYRILKICSNKEEDKLLRNSSGRTLSELESAKYLADTFYPDDNPDTDNEEHAEMRNTTQKIIKKINNENIPSPNLFTQDEIEQILRNMNPKKAPGADGLPSDICQAAFDSNPEEVMNTEDVIIGGDANASSIWWGCKADDKRGTLLMETVAELNLEILNTGKSPTFSAYRMGSLCSSIIDITLCTSSLLHKIYNWRIDDSFGTISNHKPILFNLAISNKPQQRKINSTRKFNTRNADWNSFRTELEKAIDTKGITKESIEKVRTIEDLDKTVVDYTECILEASSKTIPTIKRKQISKAAKWWNAELKEKKDEMIRIRRRIKNAHPRRRDHVIQQYLIAKEDYTTSIERASTKSWKDLCNKEEKETIWQRTYRILKVCTNREEDKLLRDQNGEILSAKQSAALLAETFYPKDSCNTDTEEQSEIRERVKELITRINNQHTDTMRLFTQVEIEHILNNMDPKKAP
ncbi:unnamed protein product, partial [Parnassius apollo]